MGYTAATSGGMEASEIIEMVLIVILNDRDMLEMIGLRAEGAVAEDHLRRKIADFRKSL